MNVICLLSHNVSRGNCKPQTANIQLPIFFSPLIIIWKAKLECMHRDGAVAFNSSTKTPVASTRVPIMSNFVPIHIPVRDIRANTVWKLKFNGYCNECWLGRSEKAGKERSTRDAERRGLFRCSGVVGFHKKKWFGGNMIIIFFSPFCFPLYTGESSAARRQGAPSTRIIRRFFTSDKQAIWLSLGLFEENMFLHQAPGSPTSGEK